VLLLIDILAIVTINRIDALIVNVWIVRLFISSTQHFIA